MASFTFDRPRHQTLARLLLQFDSDLLVRSNCYFGGGTAIVMLLDEYRESVDPDFLCADVEGYRALRSSLTAPTLGSLLPGPMRYVRDVRTERDKISAFIEFEEIPIKIAFILEARIALTGSMDSRLAVPVLSRQDMFAEKLLANSDRGLDRSTMSRDLIDLAMMIKHWGPVPDASVVKALRALRAYGPSVIRHFDLSLDLLSDKSDRDNAIRAMGMNPIISEELIDLLQSNRPIAQD